MNSLTFWQALAELFLGIDYPYYVNYGTKEIHDMRKSDKKCRVEMITRGGYVTERKKNKLLGKGYNGCRYCMKAYDKG